MWSQKQAGQLFRRMLREPERPGGAEKNAVWCLLAARLLSPDYYPDRYQLTLSDCGGSLVQREKNTPWDAVASAEPARLGQGLAEACLRMEALHPELAPVPPFDGETVDRRGPALAGLVEELSYLLEPGENGARVFALFCAECAAAGWSALGDFFTPDDVAACLTELAGAQGRRMCDPCAASGALLAAARRGGAQTLAAQPLDPLARAFCALECLLCSAPAELCPPDDPLTRDGFDVRQFESILANPPFNQSRWETAAADADPRWQFGPPPRSNANFAWLQHILYHLAPGGRAAVLLPNGALTSRVARERTIRSAVIEAGLLEAVITLPAGLFYSTRIPCSLWLFSRERPRRDEVLLISAEELREKSDGVGKKTRTLTAGARQQLLELVERFRSGALQGRTELYAVVERGRLDTLSPNQYTLPKDGRPSRREPQVRGLSRELQELWAQDEALTRQLKRQLEAMGFAE